VSLLVLVVGVLVPAGLLALLVGLLVTLARRPAPAPSEAAAAAQRHASVVHVASWLAWLLVPLVLALGAVPLMRSVLGAVSNVRWASPYGGVLAALYPVTAGLAYLAVHAFGEHTWPRPAGPVRRATLVRRDPADVAPRFLRVAAWVWTALIAVALVVGGATAGPGGRSFAVGSTTSWQSASPYPGWYYGVWLLPACVVVLVAAEAVLRLVAGRPAIVDAAPEYDAASRRLSAHRVLRGSQLVLGLSLSGVLLTLGYGPHAVGLTGLGYTLGAAALAVAVVAVVLAALPARAPGLELVGVSRTLTGPAAPPPGAPSVTSR
jgi:hypothetical protein